MGYLSNIPTSQQLATARQAEEGGVDSYWTGETHYYRGAFSLLASLASVTSRIKLGVGVVSPLARHPATIAMEAATVDEVSNGRFILGLGISKIMMQGLGVAASPLIKDRAPRVSPMKTMKESIEIIRRLFAGETITFQGEIFRLQSPGEAEGHGVRLGVDVKRKIPIYIGACGPRILELTGRVADGVILTLLTNPSFVSFAVSQIKKGADQAGRPPSDVRVVAYLIFSVSRDRRMALESVRSLVAQYIARAEPTVLEKVGLTSQEIARVEAKLREGGLSEVRRLVDDEMVKRFAVAGTPDDCVERLAEYEEAGLDTPVAMQILGPEPKQAVDLICNEIIPELHLRS